MEKDVKAGACVTTPDMHPITRLLSWHAQLYGASTNIVNKRDNQSINQLYPIYCVMGQGTR